MVEVIGLKVDDAFVRARENEVDFKTFIYRHVYQKCHKFWYKTHTHDVSMVTSDDFEIRKF